ncbi:MAG: hypothetical protein ACRDPA_17860 [Solirubrobacteraceae bacterium]
MLILLLMRRLSIRARMIVGLAVIAVGLGLTAAAATVASSLLIHGTVTTLVGGIFLMSAWSSARHQRRGQTAPGPRAGAALPESVVSR